MKKIVLTLLSWILIWLVLYQAWVLAHILWWVDHNPSATAFMQARLELLQEKNPDAHLQQQCNPIPKSAIT